MILVDLFIDNKIPVEFLGSEFLQNLLKLLTERGYILYNAIRGSNDALMLKEELAGLGLNLRAFDKVEKTNVIFVLDYKNL